MTLSSCILKLELNTDHIAYEYIEAENERTELVFDTKENEDRFYERFNEHIYENLSVISSQKIYNEFEDYLENYITNFNGYVKIECEEDMVDCWSHKEWCKVFVEE